MVKWLVVVFCVALGACVAQPRVSPRQAAYNELRKNMSKIEVARILRGNRRVRVIQMGDPSDPSEDLEYWYFARSSTENDYVVFSFEGKLLQWEYREPLQASQ